jgi:uncharacterized protein
MDPTLAHIAHKAESDRFGRDLRELCRRYHVRRLMVFGSTITSARRPDSDIDLLVEFEPGHVPGLSFVRLADELGDLFGVPVDLHTPASLSKYFRTQVLEEARELYAEKE